MKPFLLPEYGSLPHENDTNMYEHAKDICREGTAVGSTIREAMMFNDVSLVEM